MVVSMLLSVSMMGDLRYTIKYPIQLKLDWIVNIVLFLVKAGAKVLEFAAHRNPRMIATLCYFLAEDLNELVFFAVVTVPL